MLSGTNSLPHPGMLNEVEHRCRPVAARNGNRSSTRRARRAGNRQGATLDAGTASRARPRSFRLPLWCARNARIKPLLIVFIAASPTGSW